MTFMTIKPKDGFKIRDPFRRDFLPPEGRAVLEDDFHWQRLLRDGDVVRVDPEPKTEA